MATYKEAVDWIACNDAPADTPVAMGYENAHIIVSSMISVCLVADIWGKTPSHVADCVLKIRGFRVRVYMR